jgi:hypothetical protein
MTRHRLNRTLRRAYLILGLVLLISLAAKFGSYVPGLTGSPLEAIAKDVYDYMKDMALVFVTVVAAYLADVFQKRSKFVESLEEEWRSIVRTKSALIAYLEKPYPTSDDYIAAYGRISETIDTMRIVYRNAGETRQLVGLYPYAPLHDMRRALGSIDPRARTSFPVSERKLAQEAVWQSFYALRENFLEELDLEEPRHPLLISGGRRLKISGESARAKAVQTLQRETQNRVASPMPEVDAFLGRLYAEEMTAREEAPKGAANGSGGDARRSGPGA